MSRNSRTGDPIDLSMSNRDFHRGYERAHPRDGEVRKIPCRDRIGSEERAAPRVTPLVTTAWAATHDP